MFPWKVKSTVASEFLIKRAYLNEFFLGAQALRLLLWPSTQSVGLVQHLHVMHGNWGWDSETGHWPSSCSSSLAEVRCESRHLEPGSPPNHPLHDLPELTCAVNVLLFPTGSCAILSRVSVPKTKRGDTVNVHICHSRSRPCSLRVNQVAQKYPQDTFSTCAYRAKKNVLGI